MKTLVYKITVIGDGAVGKTSLCARYMGKGFQKDYLGTIGAQVSVKEVKFEKKTFKFQIWDIAGQPSWGTLRDPYFNGAAGTLAVFDITRLETFENIPKWIEKQWTTCNGPIPSILLGNKIDLRESFPMAIIPKQGKNLARQLSKEGMKAEIEVSYLETCAKTGENVQEAFLLLAETILAQVSKTSEFFSK
ncbi:MAG: GTP-binding protein [Candidatus Hodarchaeota archaeon]